MDTEIIQEPSFIIHPRQTLVEFCSTLSLTKKLISESISTNNGRLLIKTLIQRANTKNANGRNYPMQILRPKIQAYADVFIKENRAYCELDHPETQVVNVKNACATLERVWWDGDDVWGEFEILIGTPSGDIVRAILELGKTLGVSSRALGSLKEITEGNDAGTSLVQPDLEFISWDFVSNPSTFKAQFSLKESILLENIQHSSNKYDKVNYLLRDIICDATCELSKINRKR